MALWLNDHLEAPSKELMEVGDGTLNLFLKWGTPSMVFCTHMDTVPPYIAPEFPELLELSEEGPFGGTPLATLAPAPPTATSAGLGASSHPSLMSAGPSPYPCAGVHKPPGTPTPLQR